MDLQEEYFRTNFSPKNLMETLSPDMQVCIQNCQLCHQVCQQVLAQGLEKRGRHVEATHLKALFDCSQLCRTSADFMLRGSPLHTLICETCAQACLSLSMSCEKFGPEDKMMKICLEVSKRCEESCRRMARLNH